MKDTIIKIENLNFKYKQEYILRDIDLEIEKGEFTVIIGPRGEGKSTFLKLMAGLVDFEEGNIFYDGVNLRTALKNDLMNIHRRTAFVFQDSALISNMKLFDNIALPLRYNEIYPEEEIQQLVVEKLECVGLQNRLSTLPAFISTGQQKLAALMRAIIVNPETIFYDEPVANLDKPSQRLILKIMEETLKNNVTSIVITHEFQEFEKLIDKVIVLKDRTVYKVDSFKNIKKSKNEFINSLIE